MKRVLFIIGFWLVLVLAGYRAMAQDIMANGGTLTASADNSGGPNAGEGSLKLIDNDVNSKVYIGAVPLPLWFQFHATAAATAGQYSLTSGGDADTRDPKNWTLQGSNNGSTWTVIDTRNNEVFPGRTQTRIFDVQSSGSYSYYRFNITATAGSANFQLAEWRLLEGVAPGAPASLTLLAIAGNQLSLTWIDNAINESSFEVERSADGVVFTRIATTDANATGYADDGLQANTRYYYRVRAINNFGNSAYTNIASALTLNLGGALEDITDDGGVFTAQYENDNDAENSAKLVDNNFGTKYLLFGDQQTDPPYPDANYYVQYQALHPKIVTGYTITTGGDAPERDPKDWELLGSNNGTTWTAIDTRSNQSFAGRGVGYSYYFANTTPYLYYRWHITANRDPSQGIAGQISEWQVWGIDPTAPSAPTALDITGVTVTGATMSWQDNATNESGYEVQRSEDGISFTTVATSPANTATYTDQGLLGGYQYYYRVRATGTSSRSFWSNVADTTTDYDPNLALTPRNLEGSAVSETEIQLTWEDRSANETGFQIERSLDGSNFTIIDSTNVDENGFTDTGLTLATRYYYRALAYNSFGNSFYSNIAEVISGGANQPPTMDDVANQDICDITAVLTINLTGITSGPETGQQVALFARADDPGFFSELSVGTVDNGKAVLSYKSAGVAGTGLVYVTAKDNGNTLNNGVDTLVKSFSILVTPVVVSITSDNGVLIDRGQTATLHASGANTYKWGEANGVTGALTGDELRVRPNINTAYVVTGTNARGCSDTASLVIQLKGSYKLEPVNVLTPNGDGKNDKWVVWNINTFPDNEVQVFDRSGRVVFYRKNYMNDWDGTYNGSPLPEGAYIYVIRLGLGIPEAKGVLTIIRSHK